jgi:hypothetical protein
MAFRAVSLVIARAVSSAYELSHYGLKMGQFDGATFVCLLQSL